jgi:hypothetical protein
MARVGGINPLYATVFAGDPNVTAYLDKWFAYALGWLGNSGTAHRPALLLNLGRFKTALRKKGKPIPDNDLWIAAVAQQHGL